MHLILFTLDFNYVSAAYASWFQQEKNSTFSKRTGLSQRLSIIVPVINCKQNLIPSLSAKNKRYSKKIKTFTWDNSKTKCHLKIKFFSNLLFNETLCLKRNWNPKSDPSTGCYWEVLWHFQLSCFGKKFYIKLKINELFKYQFKSKAQVRPSV